MHISSSQFAQSIDYQSVQAYKTPNSCGEGLLGNLFGVKPIPTGYSLYTLNPLLPGLEHRPAPLLWFYADAFVRYGVEVD